METAEFTTIYISPQYLYIYIYGFNAIEHMNIFNRRRRRIVEASKGGIGRYESLGINDQEASKTDIQIGGLVLWYHGLKLGE